MAVMALAAGPALASGTSNFCVGNYSAGQYCNQGHNHNLTYIAATSTGSGFGVYRATGGAAGAPSASGSIYVVTWTGSVWYVYQDFHNYAGYAATAASLANIATGDFGWSDA